MIIILYTLLMSMILAFLYPVAIIYALFGHKSLWKRLHPPLNLPTDAAQRIWIHAASVGEAGIAIAVAGEIHKKFPQASIVISTITTTGLDRIHQLNESPGNAPVENVFLSPFDHPLITINFVNTIKPTSFILVETELWPWLIQSISRADVPITIINGKLSRRAFRRYMIFRRTAKKIITTISLACVQSRTFGKRYRILGVPQERIEIIGNVKFDALPQPDNYDTSQIRTSFGIPDDVKIFVAGSTRPGEEDVLVRSFKNILRKNPDAVMILAPRHLNRVLEIEKIVSGAGLSYKKRSTGRIDDESKKQVLILDTMGELITAFACADVSFVGGSLRDFGGHNPLEPASLGKPVVFGPYMEQTGSKELLSEGAAILVHDEEEIIKAVNTIFENSGKSRLMAEAGPKTVERFKGTISRTIRCMENRQLI